ncbi:MAG: aminotransferase class IV [Planctomycetota bacterium]
MPEDAAPPPPPVDPPAPGGPDTPESPNPSEAARYDWLVDGRLVPPDQATVEADDAGLQHAVGLFETMICVHGRVFRLDEHLERLAGSAVALGMAREIDQGALADAVRGAIRGNRLERARIRLTVTPGRVGWRPTLASKGAEAAASPTQTGDTPAPPLRVIVAPSPSPGYDPAYFERGVTVTIAGPLANPFDPHAGHKTLSYWSRLSSLRRAAEVGAGETIWLSVTNHLASGAVSNLLLVRKGELFTPFARGEEVPGALGAPVLPGVTRAAVLERAEQAGLKVKRKMLTVEELLDADEVFLTNSGWGVLPVTQVESKKICDGRVGPVTSNLRLQLLETIDRETSAAPGSAPGSGTANGSANGTDAGANGHRSGSA